MLKKLFGVFSPYVSDFERKVDKFFRGVKSTDSIFKIREELLQLMQKDLIVVSVWLERKYKGYKYLDKGARRQMYADVRKIEEAFNKNFDDESLAVAEGKLKLALEQEGFGLPEIQKEKLLYLFNIMRFLAPGKIYQYIKTASFGKLLRDPAERKLEGDCNQIVTLYAYLYSLKYPLEDLEIKLVPGHVCLHFEGIDIEATTGRFAHYVKDKQVLPITEIVSTNLLDLTDFREEVQSVSPRDMVKSAQLAYAVSSLKTLVSKNLQIAYRNLGLGSLKAKDFDAAIFFLDKAEDSEALNLAYSNAAAHFLKKKNYKKARFYADKAGEKKLVKSIEKQEAVDEYNKLAKRVAGVKTLDDARKFRSSYKRMLELARKIGDSRLESGVKEVLKEL